MEISIRLAYIRLIRTDRHSRLQETRFSSSAADRDRLNRLMADRAHLSAAWEEVLQDRHDLPEAVLLEEVQRAEAAQDEAAVLHARHHQAERHDLLAAAALQAVFQVAVIRAAAVLPAEAAQDANNI